MGNQPPDNAFDQLFANPQQPWCPDCRTHREEEGTSRCSSCGGGKVFVPAEMKNGRNICSGIACFCVLGIFFPNGAAALVPAFVCMLIAGSCGSRYSSWGKWAEKRYRKKARRLPGEKLMEAGREPGRFLQPENLFRRREEEDSAPPQAA